MAIEYKPQPIFTPEQIEAFRQYYEEQEKNIDELMGKRRDELYKRPVFRR